MASSILRLKPLEFAHILDLVCISFDIYICILFPVCNFFECYVKTFVITNIIWLTINFVKIVLFLVQTISLHSIRINMFFFPLKFRTVISPMWNKVLKVSSSKKTKTWFLDPVDSLSSHLVITVRFSILQSKYCFLFYFQCKCDNKEISCFCCCRFFIKIDSSK